MEMIGVFVGVLSFKTARNTPLEFERASERKSPRQQKLHARFQHPAHRGVANSAAWQRTAGRNGARDSSAQAHGDE